MGRATSARRWLAELDNLALAASQASPEAEEQCLHDMVALLRACPEGYRLLELEGERAETLARRLAAGACESAAMTLLPVHAGVMTSRGGNGTHFASVVLDGEMGESTSIGSTFALALVGALALSIVDVAQPVMPAMF